MPGVPPDTRIELLSRTIGRDSIVDELLISFTHSAEMTWMLPGVAATGKWVEVPVVTIVRFHDGLIASEHVFWDQACVLVQVGLLDPAELPVVGIESARRLRKVAAIAPGAQR